MTYLGRLVEFPRLALATLATPPALDKGDASMLQNDKNNDAALLKTVNQKLSRGGGGSRSPITATVQRGTVTLTGSLQYDAQRSPLTKAVASVAGVRRVIDQLTVAPRVNHYAAAEARAEATANEERKAARDAQAAEGADAVLDQVVDNEQANP